MELTANSLLYCISKSNLNKLQRVQHSLACVVLKRHPLQSSNGSLSELHLLPIHHHINFKLATLSFKAISSLKPPQLLPLLHPYLTASAHNLRSSSIHILAIPICLTEFSKRTRLVSFSAPSVWNSISIEIGSSSSLPFFKRSLQSYFFSRPSVVYLSSLVPL